MRQGVDDRREFGSFAEIYGGSVSKETFSRITDKVFEEMNELNVTVSRRKLRGDLHRRVSIVRTPTAAVSKTSSRLASFAREHNLARSVGRTGVRWDAAAESFWATMKVEFHDRHLWPSRTAAKQAVGDWIKRVYNRRSRHSRWVRQSPRLRRSIQSDGTSR